MKTYKAVYDPLKNKGVFGISLVAEPAMEGLFIALKKHSEIQLKEIDKEQHILMGLVLEPEKNIYRNQDGEEYNLVFSSDTIKELCYAFTKNQHNKNSSIEHTEDRIEGVTFVENWIVENPDVDKSTNFGFSYPKGSWMSVMKVDNEEVWTDYVKTGKIKGYSIDAMLSLEEINLKTEVNMSEQAKTNSLLERILLAFQGEKKEPEKEVKLGSIPLADGSLTIEFDGDVLEAGISCWVNGDGGVRVPMPIGEYPLEDGTILVVTQEGIVGELKAAVAEAAPAEQVAATEEGKVTSDSKMAEEIETAIKSILIKYSAIEKEVATLKTANEKLAAEVLELSKQPATKPIKSTPTQVEQKLTAYQKYREHKQKFN